MKSHKGSPLPGEVRIIGGQFKRTKLAVLDYPGLRPTPDRVRETLFNWLGQDLSGWHCVDAFAGTGSLGWEAASRGAASVVMIERNAALHARLQATQAQLKAAGVSVVAADAVKWLERHADASVDLLFLDPPFESTFYMPVLKAARRLLRPGGWIYLEAPQRWHAGTLATYGLQTHRYLRAGAVHAHLLQALEAAP